MSLTEESNEDDFDGVPTGVLKPSDCLSANACGSFFASSNRSFNRLASFCEMRASLLACFNAKRFFSSSSRMALSSSSSTTDGVGAATRTGGDVGNVASCFFISAVAATAAASAMTFFASLSAFSTAILASSRAFATDASASSFAFFSASATRSSALFFATAKAFSISSFVFDSVSVVLFSINSFSFCNFVFSFSIDSFSAFTASFSFFNLCAAVSSARPKATAKRPLVAAAALSC